MTESPETILQFGGGRFLRGFADLFVQHANDGGQRVGHVVVAQSTKSERARWLNAQQGRYQVLIQGQEAGQIVDRVETCASIRRALVAQTEWEELLRVACAPDLRLILSNTTEAGYALEDTDGPNSAPPRSFPAKLLAALKARFESGAAGVTILPCELLENNADRLRSLVLQLAEDWGLSTDCCRWIASACHWRNTLVDRIVTDAPPTHPLAAQDRLLIAAEPFALWVVAPAPDAPPLFFHPVLREADITPYFLRKVRLLNGAHTALAPRCGARIYDRARIPFRPGTERLATPPTLRGNCAYSGRPLRCAGNVCPSGFRTVCQPLSGA
jgi:tagaturonate reductase